MLLGCKGSTPTKNDRPSGDVPSGVELGGGELLGTGFYVAFSGCLR